MYGNRTGVHQCAIDAKGAPLGALVYNGCMDDEFLLLQALMRCVILVAYLSYGAELPQAVPEHPAYRREYGHHHQDVAEPERSEESELPGSVNITPPTGALGIQGYQPEVTDSDALLAMQASIQQRRNAALIALLRAAV